MREEGFELKKKHSHTMEFHKNAKFSRKEREKEKKRERDSSPRSIRVFESSRALRSLVNMPLSIPPFLKRKGTHQFVSRVRQSSLRRRSCAQSIAVVARERTHARLCPSVHLSVRPSSSATSIRAFSRARDRR